MPFRPTRRDVGARVVIGGVAGEADLPVAAHQAILLDVPTGAAVSVVKGAGEADGNAWLSNVRRV